MPHFNGALFSTCNHHIFTSIIHGIINLTVVLSVLEIFSDRIMSIHVFEMNKAADGSVALIFALETVLQYLINLKCVKIWTLNSSTSLTTLHHTLKSFLSWKRAWCPDWRDFLFFILHIFSERVKATLFFPS